MLDQIVETTFNNMMRGDWQRRTTTGFTKNINLTGHTPVPDEVREFAIALGKSKSHTFRTPGSRPWPSFIHEQQLKYIARDMFLAYFPPDSPNASILSRIAFAKLNKTRYEKLKKKVRTDYVAKTLASFYKRDDKIQWWQVFQQMPTWCTDIDSEIKVIYRLACAFKDAMSQPGMKAFPNKYRTNDVLHLIRTIRRTGDLSLFPILADALDDANFSETVQGQLLVSSYRNPEAVHTFGSWIFKATGNLEYTGGTGTNQSDSEVAL